MIWSLETFLEAHAVTLTKWAAFDVPLIGETQPWTRHFVGYSKELSDGQCTAAVVAFDPIRRLGRTKSGRVYRLEGPPGHSLPGKLVWTRWKYLSKVALERDVSEEVLELLVTRPVTGERRVAA